MGVFQSKPSQSVREQIKEELALLQKQSCAEVTTLREELAAVSKKNEHAMNKLKDENIYLASVNASLEKEIANLKSNISVEGGLSLTNLSTTELRLISEKNIDTYIKAILDNPDTNIRWMPDVVEKQIYKNIMKLVLNALETTVENSDIQFLGHRIKFVMDPVIKEPEK